MNPEIYRRAGELFDRLRQLSSSEAESILNDEAANDSEIRTAVMRLLEADRKAESGEFLAHRALDDAARLLIPDANHVPLTDTVIGNFRLGRRIGAGGMGVVYEARDLRLNRRVAIKILQQSVADESADRARRFQQEARAASLLNHPNIVSIFDSGFEQGLYFIVMEFVEGQTVRDLLGAEPRGLDSKVILDWLAQASSALSAAHQAGIVHRDIKPENLMVRDDGFVKVLDFGLAKLRDSSPENWSEATFLTRPGNIAGTIHYLSPEQVAGKRVDARSDLFSLGVVAYELATGQRPFDGPTDGAIFEAILNRRPPPPSAVRTQLPPDLDQLVMHCLEKEPELRFQTAADLRSACKRLSRDSSRSGPLPAPSVRPGMGRRLWMALGAALTLLLGVAAGILVSNRGHLSHRGEARQPHVFQRLTDAPGEETWPSISPDGKQFVYSGIASGNWRIYLQRTGGSTAIQLTNDPDIDDTQPALSPDGARIAFRSSRDGGGLFLMEATGENPRRLTRTGFLPAWSPDSRRVVYCEDTFTIPAARGAALTSLHIVDATDGSERTLATGDAIQPSWSPHGDRIAYWSMRPGGRRDIFTIAASGVEKPVAVTDDPALDWNPVWSPSGDYLYFLSDRGGPMNVWRVPIDEKNGSTTGPPEPVTVPASYVGGISLTGDGNSFLYSQTSQRIQLARVGLDLERSAVTGVPAALPASPPTLSNFTFSPDGSQLVYDTIGGDGPENLWIMNRDGTARRRLTSGPYRDRAPAWSPAGDEILFFSNRGGPYDAWAVRPDGSGLRQLTRLAEPAIQRSVWSPDASRIVASHSPGAPLLLDPRTSVQVRTPPAVPGMEKEEFLYFNSWQGNWLLGDRITERLHLPEIVIYGGSPPHLERTGIAGRNAVWLRDTANREQRYFVFSRDSQCLLYDRVTRRETPLFSVHPNRIYHIESPPGGGSLYFSEVVRDSDLWLAQFPR